MTNDLQNSPQSNDGPHPPLTVGDGYLLPEYASAFIKFVDDAQWHLIFENAPIVKDAFAGEAPYAIPESFGRSISTAGDADNTFGLFVQVSVPFATKLQTLMLQQSGDARNS